jgi:hypothetical protein
VLHRVKTDGCERIHRSPTIRLETIVVGKHVGGQSENGLSLDNRSYFIEDHI